MTNEQEQIEQSMHFTDHLKKQCPKCGKGLFVDWGYYQCPDHGKCEWVGRIKMRMFELPSEYL